MKIGYLTVLYVRLGVKIANLYTVTALVETAVMVDVMVDAELT